MTQLHVWCARAARCRAREVVFTGRMRPLFTDRHPQYAACTMMQTSDDADRLRRGRGTCMLSTGRVHGPCVAGFCAARTVRTGPRRVSRRPETELLWPPRRSRDRISDVETGPKRSVVGATLRRRDRIPKTKSSSFRERSGLKTGYSTDSRARRARAVFTGRHNKQE